MLDLVSSSHGQVLSLDMEICCGGHRGSSQLPQAGRDMGVRFRFQTKNAPGFVASKIARPGWSAKQEDGLLCVVPVERLRQILGVNHAV